MIKSPDICPQCWREHSGQCELIEARAARERAARLAETVKRLKQERDTR